MICPDCGRLLIIVANTSNAFDLYWCPGCGRRWPTNAPFVLKARAEAIRSLHEELLTRTRQLTLPL